MEKESKRESNRQNKKNNDKRYTGKYKMSHITELQMGKEVMHPKL